MTLYLLRPDVAALDEGLRKPAELRVIELRADAGIDGRIYVLPEPPAGTPPWLPPLQSVADDLPDMASTSPGAVLIFRAANRVFAAPFGRGHLRLRSDRLVADFGLRVAANRLDPEDVIAVDSRAVEQRVFLTRRHASRGTEIGALGFEEERESVHSLTGHPRDESLGRRITGRVGVLITRAVTPADLPAVAAELLDAYAARDYEQPFGVIDRQRLVEDSGRVAELDELLVSGLAAPGHGGAYLAPPEIIDWANVGGFRLSGDARGSRRQDISLTDYAANVGGTFSLDGLKEDGVTLYARDGRAITRWPLYKCLIAERREPDGVFVLADGRWWRVHPDFLAEIDAIVGSVPRAQIALPPYGPNDADEAAYNIRAAGVLGGAVALDSNLATLRGEHGRIELADIVGPGRRLIHVKRGIRAPSLSHLFAQAVGSAEALRHLERMRVQLKSMLAEDLPEVAAGIDDATMHAANWEVVIAIVTEDPTRIPGSLPFFSRAHFARSVRALRRLDYQVSYCGIGIVASPPSP